ncbi:PepSY-associated TM helix domain-containing protein [Sphingobacterium sp. LRF_L2]|uniref:PepSY-associated TM helix domain-containing protein n=1 Tax=Sphingobacterium sp. LRF_L2 TaxID=3369421 RepID=UPI003F61357C
MLKIFKKLNAWLHLWLGLVSGIIVVVLSITGCALVFQEEIKYDFLYSIPKEADRQGEQLPPSILYQKIKDQYPDKEIGSLWYYGDQKPVKVGIDHGETLLFINPYTGEIFAEVDHEDFFHFMDEGHRHLWLPPAIGRPIVGWATAIFLFITISGLILWWPKKWNKRAVKQSFTITWKAKIKRVNYDLHNVLGFYSLILALVMAFTGLIMSFPIVRQSVMWMAGGMPKREKMMPITEKPAENNLEDALMMADKVWVKVRTEIAVLNKSAVIVHVPEPDEDVIYACTDMYQGTWRDLRFNRYNGELLANSPPPIVNTTTAQWISRSNFALHTGYIGGIGTKILYFIASLICASLPITGFYIWYFKKWKKSKGPKGKATKNRTGLSSKVDYLQSNR